MRYGFSVRLYGWFYHTACKHEIKRMHIENKADIEKIKNEYVSIIHRAKDIGHSRLLNAYCMGAYFIAMNRANTLSPEENYEILKNGLYANRLFHIAMGNADSYLSPRKMKKRKIWEAQSHLRRYENDWIVDVLEKTDEFELGYNYFQCGVCKLCADENCPELAKHICQLDFVLADMMGMTLKRTQAIADGAEYCDFRYNKN